MNSFRVTGKNLSLSGVCVISENNDIFELYEIVAFFRFLCENDFNTLLIKSVIYGFHGKSSTSCDLLIPTYEHLDRHEKSVIDECAFNAFDCYSIHSNCTIRGHAGINITDGNTVPRNVDTSRIISRISSCDIEEKAYEVFAEIEPLLKQALARALS